MYLGPEMDWTVQNKSYSIYILKWILSIKYGSIYISVQSGLRISLRTRSESSSRFVHVLPAGSGSLYSNRKYTESFFGTNISYPEYSTPLILIDIWKVGGNGVAKACGFILRSCFFPTIVQIKEIRQESVLDGSNFGLVFCYFRWYFVSLRYIHSSPHIRLLVVWLKWRKSRFKIRFVHFLHIKDTAMFGKLF